MSKLSNAFILDEHLDKITEKPDCILCRRNLANIEPSERGILEFFDGCFWICPVCKPKVPDFDQTQCEPWYHNEYPPYFSKSRRYWQAWFEAEYGVTFAQYSKQEAV